MEASSRQAVAGQLDKGLLGPWERAGRWCVNKILLSLCFLHAPLPPHFPSRLLPPGQLGNAWVLLGAGEGQSCPQQLPGHPHSPCQLRMAQRGLWAPPALPSPLCGYGR